jgi:hypothetical protein
MRKKFNELQQGLKQGLAAEKRKKNYAEAYPKSKEGRKQHRKVGLLFIGLAILMSAPQLLAFVFDDTVYPRLAIMAVLIFLFGLIVFITGRLPKSLHRR